MIYKIISAELDDLEFVLHLNQKNTPDVSDSSFEMMSHFLKVSEYFNRNYPEKHKKIPHNKSEEQKKDSPQSIADEIKKLKGLMDSGVLTEEEFNAQKTKLLK